MRKETETGKIHNTPNWKNKDLQLLNNNTDYQIWYAEQE